MFSCLCHVGPKGWGPDPTLGSRKVGTHKVGARRWGPMGWAPRGWGPKISSCFSVSRRKFRFVPLSLGSARGTDHPNWLAEKGKKWETLGVPREGTFRRTSNGPKSVGPNSVWAEVGWAQLGHSLSICTRSVSLRSTESPHRAPCDACPCRGLALPHFCTSETEQYSRM